MIEFNISNQIITRKDSFRVVGDSRNYLTATFEVSEEWKRPIIVLFGYGEQSFQVSLDEKNSCKVPFEVIRPPFFTVSAFCGVDELVTANRVFVEVEKSGLVEGGMPETPTPSVFQQYVGEMHSLIENALPFVGENGNWFLYDTETGVYCDSGTVAKGYTPQKGTDYWTEEDKAEMADFVDTSGGTSNIDNAVVKGYGNGGIVKAFNPLSVELIVCSTDHTTGELVSIGDTVEAAYDTSDPENRAAGTYTYKGTEYQLSNVTSQTEVKTALGLADDERICLKVQLERAEGIAVGMTYNHCFPAGSKQRYGKIIAVEGNWIIVDGECPGIHRNYMVHGAAFPITGTSYYGSFVINGGLTGEFEITDSEGLTLHSEGIKTYATAGGHSEGYGTKALSFTAHVEGENSVASGFGSHAEGAATEASGHQSHTEGELTKAFGYASHAEGQQSVAKGSTCHAEGNLTVASGRIAHSEGNNTKAEGNYSHAEGHYTVASGMASHAEGAGNTVISTYGHGEGYQNTVGGDVETGNVECTFTITPSAGGNMGVILFGSYLDSNGNIIDFDYIIDKGKNSGTVILIDVTSIVNIHSIYDRESESDNVTPQYQVTITEKSLTTVQGRSAHAEGESNTAIGDFAHAEGRGVTASGTAAHAEGFSTTASGIQAHTEGYMTEASGDRAHAEGNNTKATGTYSHSEGYSTEATGQYTHSEGWLSKATGQVAHAEGYKTIASGRFSHAQGRETVASGAYQTVMGKYNKSNSDMAVIVGKGSSDTDRSDAFTLDWGGNAVYSGTVKVGRSTTDSDNDLVLVNKGYLKHYVQRAIAEALAAKGL